MSLNFQNEFLPSLPPSLQTEGVITCFLEGVFIEVIEAGPPADPATMSPQ